MSYFVNIRKQLIPLNWIRGIAALMVVAFHCHSVMALPKYFGVVIFPVFSAGDSGVQLFFVLSGFVIFLSHVNDPEGDQSALLMFAFKRFRRIYLPLWVVLSAVTPIVMMGIFGPPPSAWKVVVDYLILPAPNEALLAVEWTLRHEILFYIFFSLFLWRRRLGSFVFMLWGIGGILSTMVMDKNWLIEFLLNSNHMLFVFGMGVAWLYCRGERRGALFALAGGVALFSAAYTLKLSKSSSYDVIVILLGLGASAIVYGLSSIPSWNRPVWLLDKLGASSFGLYLIHFPMVSALVKIALIIDQHIHLPSKIYFIIIVTLCQLAALVFHQWVETPLIAWAGRFKPHVGQGRMAGRAEPSARVEQPSP